MAVGDVVAAYGFNGGGNTDFQPSSGVEWCLTSFMSTTSWVFRDLSWNYTLYGQGTYNTFGTGTGTEQACKIFVTNSTQIRFNQGGNGYYRYSGIVTKE